MFFGEKITPYNSNILPPDIDCGREKLLTLLINNKKLIVIVDLVLFL